MGDTGVFVVVAFSSRMADAAMSKQSAAATAMRRLQEAYVLLFRSTKLFVFSD